MHTSSVDAVLPHARRNSQLLGMSTNSRNDCRDWSQAGFVGLNGYWLVKTAIGGLSIDSVSTERLITLDDSVDIAICQ